MRCIYLTKNEIEVISAALDEYIAEHNLDELPMDGDGEYYGDDELEKYDAQRMNNIDSIYSKIFGEEK